MKLHLTTAKNHYLITGYATNDDGNFVEINKLRYTQNLIVMSDQLILDWQAADFTSLVEAHFEQILALKPEVILLGTGKKHQFLHPKIFQNLTANVIPLECMTTAAACRTYNILMSEGRKVAAMLIL